MYQELFAIIAPVFVIAGIGFAWVRTGRPFDSETITQIVTNVGTPCLVFATLAKLEVPPSSFLEIALGSALALLCFGLVGFSVLKLARLDVRSFLPALMFPNSGNMGLPLVLFAFGEPGLALGIGYFTVAAMAQFTIGVGLASGATSLKLFLKTPMIYAALAGLGFMLAGIKPPEWAQNSLDLVGKMTIPLMLMALGVSLARLKIRQIGSSLLVAALRLGMGLAVGIGVSEVMGMEGAMRGVMIIECSMPVAVFNYLFALRYDRNPSEVAGTVLLSTAISFATLPFLLMIAL